jgi:hypothetical protein
MTQLQSKVNARIAALLARHTFDASDYAGLPARAETRAKMAREGVLTLNYRQTFLDCLIGLHVDGLTPEIILALYDSIARAPAPFMTACTEAWGNERKAGPAQTQSAGQAARGATGVGASGGGSPG